LNVKYISQAISKYIFYRGTKCAPLGIVKINDGIVAGEELINQNQFFAALI